MAAKEPHGRRSDHNRDAANRFSGGDILKVNSYNVAVQRSIIHVDTLALDLFLATISNLWIPYTSHLRGLVYSIVQDESWTHISGNNVSNCLFYRCISLLTTLL